MNWRNVLTIVIIFVIFTCILNGVLYYFSSQGSSFGNKSTDLLASNEMISSKNDGKVIVDDEDKEEFEIPLKNVTYNYTEHFSEEYNTKWIYVDQTDWYDGLIFEEEQQKVLEKGKNFSLVLDMKTGMIYKEWVCPVIFARFYYSWKEKHYAFKRLSETWKYIADLLDLEYVLWFGSLLGQSRDEMVIPWDKDMDVLLLDKDMYKLAEYIKEKDYIYDDEIHLKYHPNYELKFPRRCHGYGCDMAYVDARLYYEPGHKGHVIKLKVRQDYTGMDVFSYGKDDKYFYAGNKYVRDISNTPPYNGSIRIDDVFPLQNCVFMGVEGYKCPKNVKNCLLKWFTDISHPVYCDSETKQWVVLRKFHM